MKEFKSSQRSQTKRIFAENCQVYSIFEPDESKRQRLIIGAQNRSNHKLQRIDSDYIFSHFNERVGFCGLKDVYECVGVCIGVIRSSWYDKKNQLITYVYGTAFHVTPRIIMTCTHNIFSSFRNQFADNVQFLPGIKEGSEMRLKMVGYPSQKYFKQKSFINVQVNTEAGCNGSPILALREGNYAVGIHTHKGESVLYGSAVYFDVKFLQVVQEFNQTSEQKDTDSQAESEMSDYGLLEHLTFKQSQDSSLTDILHDQRYSSDQGSVSQISKYKIITLKELAQDNQM